MAPWDPRARPAGRALGSTGPTGPGPWAQGPASMCFSNVRKTLSTEGGETVTRTGSVLQTPVNKLFCCTERLTAGTSTPAACGCAVACAVAGGGVCCGRRRHVLWQAEAVAGQVVSTISFC